MKVQVKQNGSKVLGQRTVFPMLGEYAWIFHRSEKQQFSNIIIWEHVDGQHMKHACNILANNDILCGLFSQINYDKLCLC